MVDSNWSGGSSACGQTVCGVEVCGDDLTSATFSATVTPGLQSVSQSVMSSLLRLRTRTGRLPNVTLTRSLASTQHARRLSSRGVAVAAEALCLRSPSTPRRHFHTSTLNRSVPLNPQPLDGLQSQVLRWVDAHRWHGHLYAECNPLDSMKEDRGDRSVLDPSRYGLSSGTTVNVQGVVSFPDGRTEATIEEIQDHLTRTYCSALGVEIQQVESDEEREWLQSYLETHPVDSGVTPAFQRNWLSLLKQSEFLDHFLGRKFTSFKRYGLEGAESALIAMQTLFESASQVGYEKVVLGMPHRGRLNTLVSLLDYPARALFAKIKGRSLVPPSMPGWDDVASHIATSCTKKFGSSKSELTVSMLHNPSHLEAVNPVTLGKTRAKQDEYDSETNGAYTGPNTDTYSWSASTSIRHSGRSFIPPNELLPGTKKVLALSIHGDSAMAGQGIVPETIQMAYLDGFSVGGSIHLVVNNQLGFTTGGVGRNRSSRYSSDITRIISMPVIHVNAESPASVAYAAKMAIAFQSHFHRDILIDLLGYRRHGHNEVDEPAFTQPGMYKEIRARSTIVDRYAKELHESGIINDQEYETTTKRDLQHDKLLSKINRHLEKELEAADTYQAPPEEHFQKQWKGYGYTSADSSSEATAVADAALDSGVEWSKLKEIGQLSVAMPPPPPSKEQQQPTSSFKVHPRLQRSHINARLTALDAAPTSKSLDWATCETLAFGSLQSEGYHIRIVGQDVERGTFSQRHHVLTDQNTGFTWAPLRALGARQGFGRFHTINSHLSEESVLGFEYGYALESPKHAVVWEAQFGDFFNEAQPILDSLVIGSESKWLRAHGLIVLLPHGYDGAGPEHSSCRMERFLQMSDDPHALPTEHPAQVRMSNANKTIMKEVYGKGKSKTNNKKSSSNSHAAATSADISRHLNLLIANPTTPSNYFHLLRRQYLRPFRKPLVIVGPKTLLRHAKALSAAEEIQPGTAFKPILSDEATTLDGTANASAEERIDPAQVKTVVLLTGKLYYDLIEKRAQLKRKDLVFIRLEELAPFPRPQLVQELSKYTAATKLVWLQEEPSNMGAWNYVAPRLQVTLAESPDLPIAKATKCHVEYIGRQALPVPAVGAAVYHKAEINKFMEEVFAQ